MLRKCYEILHFKWISCEASEKLFIWIPKHNSRNSFLVGKVLTASLLNSIIFTLLASFYVDQIGRRKMLIIFPGLMSLSGAIFLTTNNFIALIGAALIGTINVTGSETGAFLSIKQAVLPNTVDNIK